MAMKFAGAPALPSTLACRALVINSMLFRAPDGLRAVPGPDRDRPAPISSQLVRLRPSVRLSVRWLWAVERRIMTSIHPSTLERARAGGLTRRPLHSKRAHAQKPRPPAARPQLCDSPLCVVIVIAMQHHHHPGQVSSH